MGVCADRHAAVGRFHAERAVGAVMGDLAADGGGLLDHVVQDAGHGMISKKQDGVTIPVKEMTGNKRNKIVGVLL